MYGNARFQSFRTTWDFGITSTQIYMDDETFEKINIKIAISRQSCNSALNFNQYGEPKV